MTNWKKFKKMRDPAAHSTADVRAACDCYNKQHTVRRKRRIGHAVRDHACAKLVILKGAGSLALFGIFFYFLYCICAADPFFVQKMHMHILIAVRTDM